MILLQFGYTNIKISTFWTGTADGQFENSLAYKIDAIDNEGCNISIQESCFKEVIEEIFYEITNSDINTGIVKHISDEEFKNIND